MSKYRYSNSNLKNNYINLVYLFNLLGCQRILISACSDNLLLHKKVFKYNNISRKLKLHYILHNLQVKWQKQDCNPRDKDSTHTVVMMSMLQLKIKFTQVKIILT